VSDYGPRGWNTITPESLETQLPPPWKLAAARAAVMLYPHVFTDRFTTGKKAQNLGGDKPIRYSRLRVPPIVPLRETATRNIIIERSTVHGRLAESYVISLEQVGESLK
jgi:hypothetical protein